MKPVLCLLALCLSAMVYAEGVAPQQEDEWLREKDAEYRARKLVPVPDPVASPPQIQPPTPLDPEILANYDYVNAHKKAWRAAESEFKEKYPKWWAGDVCSPELFEVADRCSIGYLDRLPRDMLQAMKDKGWAATKVNLAPLPRERGKPYCNDPECAHCLKTDPKHITKILQRLKRREIPEVLPEVIPEDKKRIRPWQKRQNQKEANAVA